LCAEEDIWVYQGVARTVHYLYYSLILIGVIKFKNKKFDGLDVGQNGGEKTYI
jgi:hypothetical protein